MRSSARKIGDMTLKSPERRPIKLGPEERRRGLRGLEEESGGEDSKA